MTSVIAWRAEFARRYGAVRFSMSLRLIACSIVGLLMCSATATSFGSSQGTPLKVSPDTPRDHLKIATRKLNEALSVAGTTGDTRAKMAQLASYVNELDLSYRGKTAGSPPRPNDDARPRSEWQRPLEAVMNLLLDLLGPVPTPGTKLDPAKGSLRDERVRARLQDMRVLLQQFDASAK